MVERKTARRMPTRGQLLAVILACVLVAESLLVGVAPDAGAKKRAKNQSKDGLIAFISNRTTADNPEGDYEIFVMRSNGKSVKQLTFNDDARDSDPAWSPDGKSIAFISNRDQVLNEEGDVTGEIYVMKADGSQQTRLTDNDDADFDPDWSPDGKQIAFTSNRDETAELSSTSIFVMQADGSSATRVTTVTPGSYDEAPAWSPDGDWIAFRRSVPAIAGGSDAFDDEVSVIRPDGSDLTNLTNDPAHDESPAWSPDGTRIAFWSDRDDDNNGDLYVMDANGGNPTRLTEHPEFEHSPAWSPDGKRIAFIRYSEDAESDDIFVMRADGSGVTKLTNDPAGESWDDSSPDWKPVNGKGHGKKKHKDHGEKRHKHHGKHRSRGK